MGVVAVSEDADARGVDMMGRGEGEKRGGWGVVGGRRKGGARARGGFVAFRSLFFEREWINFCVSKP